MKIWSRKSVAVGGKWVFRIGVSVINKKGNYHLIRHTPKNSIEIKKKTQGSTDRIDICTRYHRKRSYKSNTKILNP